MRAPSDGQTEQHKRPTSLRDNCWRCGARLVSTDCGVCAAVQSACPVLNTRVGRMFIEKHVRTDPVSSLFLARSNTRRESEWYVVRMLPIELWGDPVARLAFARAQQVRSSFKAHPNITQVIDTGEDPNGGLWVVMEWVDGQWLDSYMGEPGVTPLSPARAVDLARQMVAGIKTLHDNQIVHGRIHLGSFWRLNQMTDSDDWLRLVDAGVCRSLNPKVPGPERQLVASLSWSIEPGEEPWAPYVPLSGDEQRPTIEADLHAILVCLYEMLTGSLPWNERGIWVDPPQHSKRLGQHRRLVALLERSIGPGDAPFHDAGLLYEELDKLLKRIREREVDHKSASSANRPRFHNAPEPTPTPEGLRNGGNSGSRPRGVRGRANPVPPVGAGPRVRARVRRSKRRQRPIQASSTHVREEAILQLAEMLSAMAEEIRSELGQRRVRSRRAVELDALLGPIPGSSSDERSNNTTGNPRNNTSGPGRREASSMGRRSNDRSSGGLRGSDRGSGGSLSVIRSRHPNESDGARRNNESDGVRRNNKSDGIRRDNNNNNNNISGLGVVRSSRRDTPSHLRPGYDPGATTIPPKPRGSNQESDVGANILRPSRPRPYRAKSQPPSDPAPSPSNSSPGLEKAADQQLSSGAALGRASKAPRSSPRLPPRFYHATPSALEEEPNDWLAVAVTTSLDDTLAHDVRNSHRQNVMRSARPLFELADQVIQANDDYVVFLLRHDDTLKSTVGRIISHLIAIDRACAPYAPAAVMLTERLPTGLSTIAEDARLSELAIAAETVTRSVERGQVVANTALVVAAGLETVFRTVPRPVGAAAGTWTSFSLSGNR